MHRIIVAGSRSIMNKKAIFDVLNLLDNPIDEIVSGTAPGPDKYGEEWAGAVKINVKQFPADWAIYGKSAGCVRNHQMAEYADYLIAFYDGKSSGTKHMVKAMMEKGKPLEVHIVNG